MMDLNHVVTVRDVLDWVEIGGFSVAAVCGCISIYFGLAAKWWP